jgi:hypothetical protein
MSIETLLLNHIQAHWRKYQPDQLDRGVWVALHEMLAAEADEPSTPVIRSWFMTNTTIEGCSPISFKLFAENKLKVRANELHEMGESNIAPYPVVGNYYMDFIFAPLWGEGIKISISNKEAIVTHKLWLA